MRLPLPLSTFAHSSRTLLPRPLPVPLSFPRFFSPSIGTNGLYLPLSLPSPPRVESTPSILRLQSSSALRPLLLDALSSAEALRRLDSRVTPNEVDQMREAVQTLADSYRPEELIL